MPSNLRYIFVFLALGFLVTLMFAYAFASSSGTLPPTPPSGTFSPLPAIGNPGGSVPDTETPTAAPVIVIPSPSATRRPTVAPTDTLIPTPRSSTSGRQTPGAQSTP